MIEDELSVIAKREEMSSSDLECTYKMVDILKDISTIEAMRDAGYSRENYADVDMRYARGNSYRRGRDSMGRYTSRDYRDGYSGHDKDSMIEELRVMMQEAKSDVEREHIRRAIEELSR